MIVSLAALYGVELVDELVFGLQGAVLPQLRSDLALSYTQVGLLFTIPGLVSLAGEPLIGLIGDTRWRRALVVGGIAATAVGLFLAGIGQSFSVILLSFSILYVASGAYVNLSQATLIDRAPERAEQTMARWTLLGAIGVSAAPLIVAALFYLGYSWRGPYLALAAGAAVYTALLVRERFNTHQGAEDGVISAAVLWQNLSAALKNRELLRWVLLTELADLVLDRLLEVTALYFHDVVGVSAGLASGAVAVFTIAGLVGNILLLPLLEKVSGIRVLRVTGLVVLVLYAAFLLVPIAAAKFVLIGLVSLGTTGWFPILRAKCYQVLPGQSGVVVSVTALGSVVGLFVPLLIGRIADMFGLQWAMWVLILGPLALLVGLRGQEQEGR